MIIRGREFYKMSGSGNDFIMVDSRTEPPGRLIDPSVIRQLCARGTGIGADGMVFLEPSERAAVKLVYFNADGSLADLCGNATLCTARLVIELGGAPASGFDIEAGSGIIGARMTVTNRPEIDLQPVREIDPEPVALSMHPGERRLGFAVAGVPHVSILIDDIAKVDVIGRGRPLRSDPSLANGANVNFVSAVPGGGWTMRTYERGVEGETLACGTGAVATAALLSTWRMATSPVRLQTKSGRELTVRLRADGGLVYPSLSGEATISFLGAFSEAAQGIGGTR